MCTQYHPYCNELLIFQGSENREPLPNPWSGAPGSQAGSGDAPQSRPRSGIANASMQSLLQQMAENPQLIQNMLSAPYTQSVLQALAADPSMANRIMAENPLVASNPALQEQMRTMMPQLLQQLQNPEIHNLMSNPQVNCFLIFFD